MKWANWCLSMKQRPVGICTAVVEKPWARYWTRCNVRGVTLRKPRERVRQSRWFIFAKVRHLVCFLWIFSRPSQGIWRQSWRLEVTVIKFGRFLTPLIWIPIQTLHKAIYHCFTEELGCDPWVERWASQKRPDFNRKFRKNLTAEIEKINKKHSRCVTFAVVNKNPTRLANAL